MKNKIFLTIYLIICLFLCLIRTPFYDEAHSFMISQLPLSEIFQLTKIEGHCALWYILNKIFCHNLNCYPYNILIFNWMIYCTLVLFFWFKSPFKTIVKILILLSFPFLQYFAIITRPYGLCTLLLFLTTYLYLNNQNKKPYLFAICLFFCTQLNLVSLIGAAAFFILYIFKFKNEKKSVAIISTTFLIGMILFFIQTFNLNIEQMREIEQIQGFYKNFLSFVFTPISINQDLNIFQHIFHWIACILIYTVPLVFFKKNKDSFCFILITFLLMTLFFFIFYIGSFWHYFFYFIFLIIAYWIGYSNFKNHNFLNTILIILLILLTIPYSIFKNGKSLELTTNHYKIMLEETLELTQNSKIFCFDYYSPFSAGILPYLAQKNIQIFDKNGNDLKSLNSLKNTFKNRVSSLNLDNFIKHLDKNKNNYLINNATDLSEYCFKNGDLKIIKNKGFIYKNKNHTLYFENIKYYEGFNFAIYKINIMNN